MTTGSTLSSFSQRAVSVMADRQLALKSTGQAAMLRPDRLKDG